MNLVKLLFLLTFFFSCATVRQLHESPSIDSIEIHNNPVAGDYSILEDTSKRFRQTYRVNSVDGDIVNISFIFNFSFLLFSKQIEYVMDVNRSGRVLRGGVKYSDDNYQSQVVASKEGEMSRANYKSIKLPRKLRVKTLKGIHKVSSVASYNLWSDMTAVSTHNSYVLELSEEIPFRTVRMYQTSVSKNGLVLNILDYLDRKYSAALIPHDIVREVIMQNKGDDNTIKLEYVLIDYQKN